jgi:hypothetical protein
MKKSLLICIICTSLTVNYLQAQVFRTVHLVNSGTLADSLTPDDLLNVTDLAISGNMNGVDLNTMKNAMPSLIHIDLSAARADGDSIPRNACTQYITSIILPPTITLIGHYAFAGCSGLASITLPNTLITIGNYAFAGCTGLISVNLPDSVITLGNYGFVSCNNLKKIHLSTSLTSIGGYAFAGCAQLDSVALPSSLVSIGEYAFVACNALSEMSIPNSVTSIGRLAFASCTAVKSISLSTSLDSIPSLAFVNCSSLKYVTIPDSVKSIGPYAFAGCQALDSLTFLPTTGNTIRTYAFAGCSALKTVVFCPSALTSIADWAFAGCSGITTLNFGSPSVTFLRQNTFSNSQQLTTLVLPTSLISIGPNCFQGCNLLASLILPYSLKSIGDNSFRGCNSITEVIIPNTVDSIGTNAFYYCQQLARVTISSSVNYIGPGAFAECKVLQSVRVTRSVPLSLPAYTGIFSAFMGMPCTLYVPRGSLDAYKQANQWKNFAYIVEYDQNLSTSPSELAVSDTGINGATFDIISSTIWHISSDQPWLAVSPADGMDSASIQISVEPNNSIISRKAFLTISGEGTDTVMVQVTQAPKPALSLSVDTLKIDKSAGSQAFFNIHSNGLWTAETDQTWFTSNVLSGTGDSVITITASANPADTVRTGTIAYTADRVEPQVLVIIQEPNPMLSLTADTLDLETSESGTLEFNIMSNTNWNVSSDQPWLVSDLSAGRGDQLITITAEANPGLSERNARVSVSAHGVTTQIILVTQAAAVPTGTVPVSPAKLVVYPNPVRNKLYIDGAEGADLSLFNSQGRLMLSKKAGSVHESMDLGSLPSGIYLLQVGDTLVKITR